MLTIEEKRKYMLNIVKETEFKAGLNDFYYVICFWKSPILEAIDYRRAYFDDISEAISYQTNLIQQYKNFKWFVSSNISSGDTDGGLLEDNK